MRPFSPDRKRKFKAALALDGLTASEWAKREGVTRQHLNSTLNDPSESKPLTDKIDAFIAHIDARMASAA